ncbi:MAG: VWA domain-containing protein [Acidimicrobiia bacterium]|jgi:hypothetical protein
MRLLVDWRRIKEERGATLVLVAVSLVGLLGSAGLAIDLGRGYVTKIRLSRAVDAAVIAGASAFRSGLATALQHAEAVAALNGVVDGENGLSFSLVFGINAEGENTVSGSASRSIPTTFMRILGQNQLQISTLAVAAVPPVDLALVIDQSYSLAQNNAWDDLQAAASEFVSKFSDLLDMVGLSSFHARAVDRVPVDMPFQVAITSEIGNMNSAGYTNTGEGLRTGFEQMQNAPLRQRSTKVVVFFTDGRPTAIRGLFDGVDRVIVVPGDLSATTVSGYYNYSTLVTDPSPPVQRPFNGCDNVSQCFGLTENTVRKQARQNGMDQANQIRSAGYILYTIALGNPGGGAPPPDLDYLRILANEDGVADPNQPKGRMFFAPTSAELSKVFDLVAQDLLVRLAL